MGGAIIDEDEAAEEVGSYGCWEDDAEKENFRCPLGRRAAVAMGKDIDEGAKGRGGGGGERGARQ